MITTRIHFLKIVLAGLVCLACTSLFGVTAISNAFLSSTGGPVAQNCCVYGQTAHVTIEAAVPPSKRVICIWQLVIPYLNGRGVEKSAKIMRVPTIVKQVPVHTNLIFTQDISAKLNKKLAKRTIQAKFQNGILRASLAVSLKAKPLVGKIEEATMIRPVTIYLDQRYRTTGDYCIIDVSGGPNSSNYPVSYQAPAPPLNDEHKTSKIVLRRITADSFVMGSPTNELGRYSNETQHNVSLTKAFYMGIYEITQAQYSNVMGANPSYFKQGAHAPNRPVESVSWNTMRGGTWPGTWPNGTPVGMTFMAILQNKTGLAFDLPTEAQWEYACRATTTNALNNDTNLQNIGQDPNMDILGRYWYNGGSNYTSDVVNGGTAASGTYLVNQWGLYDMHGNVWEWCLDWYGAYVGDATDPVGAALGKFRVIRGGGWYHDARNCRSARRYDILPSYADFNISCRLSLPTGQ